VDAADAHEASTPAEPAAKERLNDFGSVLDSMERTMPRFGRPVVLLAVCLLTSTAASAQLVEEYNPPRANCCLADTAKSLADQLQDWNQIGRYHAANIELKTQPADPQRVVFMGDSITDNWRLAESFPGKPYVNRGIGGQTTPQMVVRMYPDVLDLKPAVVVILAGTNDIARNTGPATLEMIEQNFMAMTELAKGHGIKVVLCSVTPISDYPALNATPARAGQPGAPGAAVAGGGRAAGPPRRKQTEQRPPADILKLNAWLKEYAGRVNAVYADFFSAVVDDRGWLKEGISADGLHPNASGYALMAPVVEAAIDKARQQR
jgi:lysophospholipase L1-like esterase